MAFLTNYTYVVEIGSRFQGRNLGMGFSFGTRPLILHPRKKAI